MAALEPAERLAIIGSCPDGDLRRTVQIRRGDAATNQEQGLRMRTPSLLATSLAGAFAATLAAVPAQAEILIGVAGPQTGDIASFGEQQVRGAELAVADINAAGGVLGEELTLITGDDVCDPRQAVSVANDMVAEGVVFVSGHLCSGSSIPAGEVYTEEDVLMISPASTAPALTEEGGENIFRVVGRDDQQGSIAAEYIVDTYGDQRIAVVHDQQQYGRGLAEAMREGLNTAGVQEVMFEGITAGESDYSALVTRLKANDVDVVYYGGYHPEAGLIVRQMREQGMDTQLISGDGLNNDEFWAITGEAGEGTLHSFSPDAREFPQAAPVVERMREAGFEPAGFTLYSYATIQVFAQAVEAAGTTDLDAVIEALREGTFNTVVGELSFNDEGDVEQPAYVWYVWTEGKRVAL